ncbi:glycosyltransferase family 2 protein [Mangrovimonas spongiae]|uniref:Glycosyltransferase family 2 protein n=1 Tax=Mangrovimonas spongiae TaxID=2494697 RepID=A0A428K2Q7_9FLAO|nr:glycosyltransferase family 2 protein [Mangrovimonas spongiae]RSK40700.1 glycosyltransferase family 2 protein [Mangrovimonas spongiae]
MPELTVIMPVYNGEKYLEEAIDSVLHQTYTNFTLLVLNDNSTDSTPAILKKYQEQDHRVHVISKNENQGPANLRNEGIKLAETEFIALLDADDIALPTRFEKQIDFLKSNPDVGVCGTWFTVFGDKKEKILKHAVDHEALKIQFLSSCGIGNPTVMFRKSVLGDLQFEHQYVPAEDYGLWSQLIAKTKFHNIPESLLRYRWHPGNISQTKKDNLIKSEILIKKRQLIHLAIDENDANINYYLHAVSLKRNLPKNDIKQVIKAAKTLKNLNLKHKYYNQELFNAHIDKILIRTIRNAESYNMAFFNYLKKESGYFSKMPIIDKMVIFFKSLF